MHRKTALWLLCAALLLGGCGKRTRAAPEATAVPAAAPTESPAAPTPLVTPTPEPTPVPTPTPTPAPTFRWITLERAESYTLFTGTSPGAAALRAWLIGEGAALAESYALDGEDSPMFTLAFTPAETTQIANPTDTTRVIRLAADERLELSGLLAELLPAFESEYGYVVEVYSGAADDVNAWAASAAADAALLSGTAANTLNRRGFVYIEPYVSTVYAIEEIN